MACRSMQLLLRSLPKLSLSPGYLLRPQTTNIFRIRYANFTTQLFTATRPSETNSLLPGLQPQRQFHLLSPQLLKPLLSGQEAIATTTLTEQKRSVTKFSLRRGRRKTVKAVLRRFYRLDWGIWIHPKSGRHKKLWKKGKLRRKRLRQHVFCNAWHTRTLERMTTKYWHKKKYFVDDPYESYHTRNDFWITKNTKNIVHQLD